MLDLLKFFRKKEPEALIFDSAEDAFAHACLHQSYRIASEAVIPSVVVERGRPGENGEEYFLIRLADRSGGREIWAQVLPGAPSLPKVGALVGFRVVRIASDLPEDAAIIGYIAWTFAPVFVDGKGWKVTASHIPDNLKPDIHF